MTEEINRDVIANIRLQECDGYREDFYIAEDANLGSTISVKPEDYKPLEGILLNDNQVYIRTTHTS